MSRIVFSDPDTRCWARQCGERLDEDFDDVWPEVSSRYALENPAPMTPENAPHRVILEAALVLAIAASWLLPLRFLRLDDHASVKRRA